MENKSEFFTETEIRENLISHEHHDELFSSHSVFTNYANQKVKLLLEALEVARFFIKADIENYNCGAYRGDKPCEPEAFLSRIDEILGEKK